MSNTRSDTALICHQELHRYRCWTEEPGYAASNQSMEHQWMENTLYLFTPTPMSSFAQHYVLSPYCIVLVVVPLQSNLHDHLLLVKPLLIIYTFCYFKFILLYIDCVINSNSGMLDMCVINNVSFRFSFLLNYTNRACMYGMVMHFSPDESTSYFAQP